VGTHVFSKRAFQWEGGDSQAEHGTEIKDRSGRSLFLAKYLFWPSLVMGRNHGWAARSPGDAKTAAWLTPGESDLCDAGLSASVRSERLVEMTTISKLPNSSIIVRA
jgi:hypothetical protein